MLVILVIQVITIFLEITIAPYQCCQYYLKSSKICSKVATSSRGTICYMNNYNQPSILVIPLKRFKMDNDELKGLVFVDSHKVFDIIYHKLSLKKFIIISVQCQPRQHGMVSIVSRWVMTFCENRAYNIQSQNLSSGKGYCRDQSLVQFYFSYL